MRTPVTPRALLLPWLLLAGCPTGGKPAADSAEGDKDTDTDTDTDADADADTDTDTDTGTDTDTDTPAHTDVDGDGHPALDAGGDDCDDTNPAIHPGAPEWCDDIDQDCDGDPLGEGACGEVTPGAAAATPYLRFDDGVPYVGLVHDLTGDGVDDLQVLRQAAREGYVYAGAPLSGLEAGDPAAAAWTRLGASALTYQGVLEAGDSDGDGSNDLLVVDINGRADLVFGPLPGPGGTVDPDDDADVQVDGQLHGELWGMLLTGQDLDGDGRTDLVASVDTSSSWTGYEVDEAPFELHFGDDPASPCAVSLDNEGRYQTRAYAASAIGDGDGDGLAELVLVGGVTDGVAEHSGAWFVSGADVRLLCDARLPDVALTSLASPDAAGAGPSLGDWTGDGIADWVAVDTAADAGEPAVYLHSGATPFAGPLTAADALGSWLLPDEESWELRDPQAADFDGDGLPELVLHERGTNYTRVLRGGEPPGPGVDLPARHLVFDAGYGTLCGADWCGGDFDGDGFDDLVLNAWPHDGEPSVVAILRGFAVPWEDDGAW